MREYSLADAAIRHARRHQAERLASKPFRQAEQFFGKGKEDYRNQYFEEAAQSFSMAIRYARLAMRKAFIAKAMGQDEAIE